jgi:hypothetical protein
MDELPAFASLCFLTYISSAMYGALKYMQAVNCKTERKIKEQKVVLLTACLSRDILKLRLLQFA